jgi:hypothetical protein
MARKTYRIGVWISRADGMMAGPPPSLFPGRCLLEMTGEDMIEALMVPTGYRAIEAQANGPYQRRYLGVTVIVVGCPAFGGMLPGASAFDPRAWDEILRPIQAEIRAAEVAAEAAAAAGLDQALQELGLPTSPAPEEAPASPEAEA